MVMMHVHDFCTSQKFLAASCFNFPLLGNFCTLLSVDSALLIFSLNLVILMKLYRMKKAQWV